MDSDRCCADSERESKMLEKMEMCIQTVENSQFWSSFLDQMQTPEIMNRLLGIIGGEATMQMVIYGIGSIDRSDDSRWQLSLAFLMKKKFSWVGDIEVFDPIITLIESKVITALGCSVLSVNEEGRREVSKPTLFFMPHCELILYDNLLQANWKSNMLNRVAILGNSFEGYANRVSLRRYPYVLSMKHILAIRQFTKEFKTITFQEFSRFAFSGLTWHFFCIDSDAQLVVQ